MENLESNRELNPERAPRHEAFSVPIVRGVGGQVNAQRVILG